MYTKSALAIAVAMGALFFAAPQASAVPSTSGAKELNQSNVEPARHRGWRHRHYRRHGYYGPGRYYDRRYYRRPGFGIYLGF